MVANDDNEFLRRGTLLDRYEIRELIGAGGMGRVYRARDTTLDRDVVIKTLVDKSEEFIRRFMREASVMAKLIHQNVVQILDYRVSECGQPFIVMPYLRGQDLAQRLKGGPMEIGEAVDMVLGVCAGVFACHRRGIIHRDLKPRNVFLAETVDYGTVVKVLDFGVARLAQSAEGDELTSAGTMIGTPKYMAPEQVKREEADERTDQYGIGVLLYSASTRKAPFGRLDGVDLVRAILKGNYPSPRERRPEIPDELARVIGRAMQVEREARFPSVHELGRALLPFATVEGRNSWTGHFRMAPRPMVEEASTALGRDLSTRNFAEIEAAKAEGVFSAITRVVAVPELEPPSQSTPLTRRSTGTTLVEASDSHGGLASVTPSPGLIESGAQPGTEMAVHGPAEKVVLPTPIAVEAVADSSGEALPAPNPDETSEWRWRRRSAVRIAVGSALVMGVGTVAWLVARNEAPEHTSVARTEPRDASVLKPPALAPGTVQSAADGGPDAMPPFQEMTAEQPKAPEQGAARESKAAKVPANGSGKRKPRARRPTVQYTPDGWPILD